MMRSSSWSCCCPVQASTIAVCTAAVPTARHRALPMHYASVQQAPAPHRTPKEVLKEDKGVVRVGG